MQIPSVEMNVFEAILARRSIRNYTHQDIDHTFVRILLEAAVRAPTAMHHEPWAFVIIQDRQLLRRLSEIAKPLFAEELLQAGLAIEAFSDPDFNVFHDAGTLIIICCRSTGSFAAADCWLAAENLMLAACAMGLGTCLIGSALQALNLPEVKARLRIPEEFSAIAPIIVGYPDGEAPPSLRKAPYILNVVP